MDPDELEAILSGLSPEEQQQALYEMGMNDVNQVPPGYQGAFQPELSQSSYGLTTMGQMPPDIEYGDVQPFGLDEMSQAYNIMQDYGALTLDPAVRANFGPGAFSADAFDPITVPIGDPLDMEGMRYVDALAKSGSGYESYLATKIKPVEQGGAGMSPSGAVAQMWEDINNPAPGNEEIAEQLKASLPPPSMDPNNPATFKPSNQQGAPFDFTTSGGQATSTNVDAITARAQELFDRMASDPVAGYTDPNSGLQFAGSYEQPSEPSEKFAEYGLPDPTESYLDEQWLNGPMDPQAAQERVVPEQVAQQGIEAATANKNAAERNMQEMTEEWDKYTAAKNAPAPSKPSLTSFLTDERAKVGLAPIDASGGFTMPDVGHQTDAELDLQNQSVDAARSAYDTAYTDWEEENRKRSQNPATPPPTFTFGGGDKGQGVFSPSNLFGGLKVGSMTEDPRAGYASAVPNAWDRIRDAYDMQAQQHEVTSPYELQHAQGVGRALAMSMQGRTPLQDVLMQGAMGRQALMPRY